MDSRCSHTDLRWPLRSVMVSLLLLLLFCLDLTSAARYDGRPRSLTSSRGTIRCQDSTYGCCNDGVTSAKGPNRDGCPHQRQLGGCAGTRYGCCKDGVTYARGANKEGCEDERRLIGGCAGTQHGCCRDGVTAARGANNEGCEEENRTNGCSATAYGCCADRVTAATGPNAEGCPESRTMLVGSCRSTRYGCCPDGVTAASESGCPSFDHANCALPVDPGTCAVVNYAKKYYFDLNYGLCRPFWYNGCNGNQNRFSSEDECNRHCVQVEAPGVCRLPKVSGVCKSLIKRYYYNYKNKECETFTYGGCKGNSNNFESLEACQKKCQDSSKPAVPHLPCANKPCRNGFSCQDYRNGTYKCSCNPDWGQNCESPPDYWCFSDSECDDNMKCVRQKNCETGYCWIYARCSPSSRPRKCDNQVCPAQQECVNDKSFEDGYFCINAISYRRPSRVVLGCRLSEFGCCLDKKTPAAGLNYHGCPKNCLTSKYGCCSDGVTSAEGPDNLGCEIYSGDEPCEKTKYGCCEDGVTSAKGPRGQGCGDTVDSEDRNPKPSVVGKPAKNEKCTAMASQVLCKGKKFEVKWRYSSTRKECERHWWGECQDNGNVFDSAEQCKASCKHKVVTEVIDTDFINICDMPSETGPCRGFFTRFFYSPTEQRCMSFTYGGCQGNDNNFMTLEACQKECGGPSVTSTPEVVATQMSTPDIVIPKDNQVKLSIKGERFLASGDELKLSCSASGPTRALLKWYFNSIPGSNIHHAQHKAKSSVSTVGFHQTVDLIIPNAQVNNSGIYSCRSTTGQEERLFVTVRPPGKVEVTRPPQVTPENAESKVSLQGDSTVEVGSTISLTCRSYGPRRPSDIEWFFNGRMINSGSHGFTVNTYEDSRSKSAIVSELTISNVQLRNEGTYFCKSKPYDNISKMKISVRQRTGIAPTDAPLQGAHTNTTDKAVVCKLEAEAGVCLAAFRKWYYDHKEGQCKEFDYGGCGGNNNKFNSFDECNSFCSASEMCLKPKVVGRCRAAIPRYYFDYQAGTCKVFIYGGCDGNLNNFESLNACNRRCEPYKRSVGGTNVVIAGPQETGSQDICKMPQHRGDCNDNIIRWYFVESHNRCARFWYSGCGGNGNKFAAEEECLSRCQQSPRPVTSPPQVVTAAPGYDISACAQPKMAGDCAKWQLTWYYDMSRKICHQFYYGGCGGNSNRFPDRASCERLCIPETTRPERTTQRFSECVYTTFGCCDDGVTRALDRQKSNCYESNVVIQPSVEHTVVTVQIGSDATLTCRLRGSEMLWYKDSLLLSSTWKTEIYSNGSLVLKRVTEDMAGVYSCRVLDRNSVPRLERYKVQITVPLDILPGPTLMSFKPGSRAFLYCQTVGYPPATITWHKNGREIVSNSHHSVHRNGTLIINDVKAEDAGNYICYADNGMTTKKTRSVTVNIKETISARIAHHKGTYTEEEEIKLTCVGSGYPAPELEWVKDDRTLTSDNTMTVSGGELTIKSASIEDSGMYKCVARNTKTQAVDITTVHINLERRLAQCRDKLIRVKCLAVVRAALCGIRHYYSQCCRSCELHGKSLS